MFRLINIYICGSRSPPEHVSWIQSSHHLGIKGLYQENVQFDFYVHFSMDFWIIPMIKMLILDSDNFIFYNFSSIQSLLSMKMQIVFQMLSKDKFISLDSCLYVFFSGRVWSFWYLGPIKIQWSDAWFVRVRRSRHSNIASIIFKTRIVLR